VPPRLTFSGCKPRHVHLQARASKEEVMIRKELTVRELTDSEVEAVSGGLLNFFSFQSQKNYTKQTNIAWSTGQQINDNWTVQVNL
jgi:hypothetical protein